MKYFVGIDGGGTKTKIGLGNHNKQLIGCIEVGATNYHSMGIDNTKEAFEHMFSLLNSKYGVLMEEIEVISFCGAGIDCKEDEKVIEKLFRTVGYKNDLLIYNDSIGALVGANKKKHGAILISGTGSICLGINKNGETFRVGGWGHIIDDLGSAYAIARDALKKVFQAYDGRDKKTLLWNEIKKKIGINEVEELITFIYNPMTKKQDIAALAPIVIDAYEKDEIAKKIIDNAIDDLAHMIITLAIRMNEFKLNIKVGGSVLIKSSLLRQLLRDKIQIVYSTLDIALPLSDPTTGALILAWNTK